MEKMAPEGNIYQAGTLSGNPLAMSAGLATLKELRKGKIYQELEEKGRILFSGLEEAAGSSGLEVAVNRVGSMGSLFFTAGKVRDFASAKASDGWMFRHFYRSMLEQGIYLAPSPFEAWFISTKHDTESLDQTISCAKRSFASLRAKGP